MLTQMKSTFKLMLLALTFGMALGSSQGAEKRGTLIIKIGDASETPLTGVSIKAVCIRDSKETTGSSDAKGICTLDVAVGTYCVTVRGPGFRPDFMGGPVVREKGKTAIRFMLMPGDPNEKLPHEKTPKERAIELAKAQAKKGEEKSATPLSVMNDTWEGLDDACKDCKITRTNGGPAARAVLIQEALEAVNNRNYPQGLAKYKKAIGEDAADPTSWFNCGVLFNIQRQSKPAEICFRTAIGLCGGGGEAVYHAYLGRALGTQGRLVESEKAFSAAITIDPKKEGQYAYELGCQFHKQRIFPKAVKYFDSAIKKNCPDPQVYFAHANALEMLGKKKGAIASYKLFIEKGAKDPQLAKSIERTKKKLARLEKK